MRSLLYGLLLSSVLFLSFSLVNCAGRQADVGGQTSGGPPPTPPSPPPPPPPPPPPAPAVSVTVAPDSASVIITQTQQFIATVSNATDASVTWSVNGIAGGD